MPTNISLVAGPPIEGEILCVVPPLDGPPLLDLDMPPDFNGVAGPCARHLIEHILNIDSLARHKHQFPLLRPIRLFVGVEFDADLPGCVQAGSVHGCSFLIVPDAGESEQDEDGAQHEIPPGDFLWDYLGGAGAGQVAAVDRGEQHRQKQGAMNTLSNSHSCLTVFREFMMIQDVTDILSGACEFYYFHIIKNQIMISQPLCQYSLGEANKFCVHPDCKLNAFICKHCADEKCQNAHIHNGLLSVKKWSTLSSQITSTFQEHIIQDEHRLVKEIKDLISNLTKSLENYARLINDLRSNAGLQPQVRQTLNNLRSGNTLWTSGADMKQLVESLSSNVQDAIKGQIKKQLDSENHNLMGSLSKYIEDFQLFLKQYKFETLNEVPIPIKIQTLLTRIQSSPPVIQTIISSPTLVHSQSLKSLPKTLPKNSLGMKFTKIKDIPVNAYNLNIIAKIVAARLQIPHSNKQGLKKFVSCLIGDETGVCGASFEASPLIEIGSIVEIRSAHSKIYRERIQLQVMKQGQILKSDKQIHQVNLQNNISGIIYEK